MKKHLLKILSATLTSLILLTQLVIFVPAADNSEEFNITGYDATMTTSGVVIYPNDSNSPRVIGSSTYNFRYTKLLIFDKDGWLIEAGGELLANENGVYGSPQLTVTIPAGGFMVGFGTGAPKGLRNCFNTAMEGAVLYNATMSVIYEVKGSYNKSTNKLKLEYDDPAPVSDGAERFMFIGNSSTYFNGTPIKLKGLAAAAGVEIDVDYCTFGSAYLSEFANENHSNGRAFRTMIGQNKYDYVVLQDASSADYNMIINATEILLPLIEKNGAEAVFYMRYGTSIESNGKHHANYEKAATKFDLNCAPAADAYAICMEEHPEINLFADDGGHHSKEGSYLIACVWLMSYLGIDPRGNEYNAQLPADVVKTLQDIAYDACKNGYGFPETTFTYTDKDGIKYKNIALNKKYVPDGAIYNDEKWTDTNSDGTPMGKFTDGLIANSGSDTANGCYKGNKVGITIDLGAVSEVIAIRTELHGNTGWGIPDPSSASVTVSISEDGKKFTDIGEAVGTNVSTGSEWKKKDFLLELDNMVKARYVKVTFNINGNFCWLSEIGVFGNEPEPPKFKKGDVNMSGEIDAYDYAMIKRAYLGTATLTDEQFKLADINDNGKLDVTEYGMVKRHYLGTFDLYEN